MRALAVTDKCTVRAPEQIAYTLLECRYACANTRWIGPENAETV